MSFNVIQSVVFISNYCDVFLQANFVKCSLCHINGKNAAFQVFCFFLTLKKLLLPPIICRTLIDDSSPFSHYNASTQQFYFDIQKRFLSFLYGLKGVWHVFAKVHCFVTNLWRRTENYGMLLRNWFARKMVSHFSRDFCPFHVLLYISERNT